MKEEQITIWQKIFNFIAGGVGNKREGVVCPTCNGRGRIY